MTTPKKIKLRSLAELDGRTHAARKAASLISALEVDLGIDVSTMQAELIKRAALSAVLLEDIEASWLQEQKQIDIGDYVTLSNCQRRVLATLGLQRVPITVEQAKGYLAVLDEDKA